MTIGFVLDDGLDSTDGVQQYVTILGQWFSDTGHNVHYLVGETHRNDIENIHSLSRNIKVRFNQNRMSIPLPAKNAAIKKILDSYNFDVLHVQLPYSPMLAAKIIKKADKNTVIIGTFHVMPFSSLEKKSTLILMKYLNKTNKRFDEMIAVSKPAAKFVKSTMKLSPKIIPNAVSVGRFKDAQKISDYNDGKINIVYLGRLVKRKGCLELIKALEILYKTGVAVDVRVLICGDGPLKAKRMRYVTSHGLDSLILFKGYVSEKAKANYLKTADIAVFPSLGGESFGIVLIEAMAADSGAIIAGNNSGYSSVLLGHSSQLINPKQTDAFAEKLSYFVKNATARSAARSWQTSAVAKYEVSQVAKQITSVYEAAIAKKRKNHNNSSH